MTDEDPSTTFAGRRVLVLGLGITGRAVASVLAQHGAQVFASDVGTVAGDVVSDLTGQGVEVETGGHDRAAASLGDLDFVVPSPGISPVHGFLADVIARNVRVVSELDLAERFTSAPIVAVTGTNGKTTVCRLAERIGRQAGLAAYACGNLEAKFISAAAEHPDADLFVVEASSFALAFAQDFHPRVAVITNLSPAHLDWHGSFDAYREAKARIAARQTDGDVFVYPAVQPELAELAPAGVRRVAFSSSPNCPAAGAWIDGDEIVVRLGEDEIRASGVGALARRAPYFAVDAAAASVAMLSAGVEPTAIERALTRFSLDHHRLEPLGSLNGVAVFDDSKSTNPHSTVAALRSFDRRPGRVVLIAGGAERGIDLSPLAAEAKRLRMVVALGETAPALDRIFGEAGVGVRSVGSMPEAVAVAIEEARPDDVIVLSPACASLDMYSNYVERGRAFQEACAAAGVTS